MSYQISQPAGVGDALVGRAMNNAWLDAPITVTGTAGGQGSLWEHSILYRPSGSSAIFTNANQRAATFTPDVIGTYRIRLVETINGTAQPRTQKVIRVTSDAAGVDQGIVSIAPDETPSEADYDGNEAGFVERFQANDAVVRTLITRVATIEASPPVPSGAAQALADASTTLTSARRGVRTVALTADRTDTLPDGTLIGERRIWARTNTGPFVQRLVYSGSQVAVLGRTGRVEIEWDGAAWRVVGQPIDPGRWYSPEDFGAVGDGTTDDTAAWQAMLALSADYGAKKAFQIRCSPGREYLITSTLQFGPILTGQTKFYTYIVDGRGASLKSGTALGANPLIALGYYNAGSSTLMQLLYCCFEDLFLFGSGTNSSTVGCSGISLRYVQFSVFRRILVNGYYRGVVTEQSGGNSNAFDDCQLAGGNSCYYLGYGGTFAGNMRIQGGKIQQAYRGISIYGQAQISLSNIDLSIIDNASVYIEQCGEVSLRNLYTEGIDRAVEVNGDSIVRIVNSKSITIDTCRINGVGSPYDADYGVRLEGCQKVSMRSTVFTQHRLADVSVDADCSDIEIEATCWRSNSGFDNVLDQLKVTDLTRVGVRNLVRTKERPAQLLNIGNGGQVNLIEAPSDFSGAVWTRTNVTISGTTIIAPDGKSPAQIVNFPNTSGAGATGSVSFLSLTSAVPTGQPLDGKTLCLRYWVKPISVINAATPSQSFLRGRFTRDLAAADSKRDTPMACNGSEDWTFVEQVYVAPTIATNTGDIVDVRFNPSDGTNGISVAIWGVQLFVRDTTTVPVVSSRMAWFDAEPVAQQADPGKLIDSSAGTAALAIVAVPSPADTPATADALRDDLVANAFPALRNNIASLTYQVNALRTVLRTYGLLQRANLKNLTGLTLLIDPAYSVDVPIDGQPVSTCKNVKGGTSLVQTGSNRPTYSTSLTALDTRCIDFEASSSQYLRGGVTVSADTYISAGTHVFVAVVQVESIANDSAADPCANDGIMGDASGYVELSLRSTGPAATGGAFSGGYSFVQATTPAIGTAFLVRQWHVGGTTYIQVNNNAVVSSSTNSGDITSITGFFDVGRGFGARHLDGKIGLLAVFDQYVAAEQSLLVEAINERFGLW